MKSAKIKKNSHRRVPYIPGGLVAYFKKPKLPLYFFTKITPPTFFDPSKITLQISN